MNSLQIPFKKELFSPNLKQVTIPGNDVNSDIKSIYDKGGCWEKAFNNANKYVLSERKYLVKQ